MSERDLDLIGRIDRAIREADDAKVAAAKRARMLRRLRRSAPSLALVEEAIRGRSGGGGDERR